MYANSTVGDRYTERYSDRYTVVELLGRYSNFPQPLLSGRSIRAIRALRDAIRAERAESSAPRVHAIHRRLSADTLQHLLCDYEAGISASQLVGRYHLSRGSVRRLLREAQVLRRYQAMTDNEIDQAAELYQSGLTIAQVAAKLNRPWSTVQAALGRRGVVTRSRHDYH